MRQVGDPVHSFGGLTALDRIGFDVADKEICGRAGPDGAGTTSLFDCVTRVCRAEPGIDHLRRNRPSGPAPPPDPGQWCVQDLPEPSPATDSHPGGDAMEVVEFGG